MIKDKVFNSSIKLRITAWFTLMILLLMVLVVVIVYVIEDESLAQNPKSELIHFTSINAARLNDDEHKDKLEFRTYNDGVYCVYYDFDGHVVAGAIPKDIKYNSPFENGSLATYTSSTDSYYVYDIKVTGNNNIAWIRGFISTTAPSPIVNNIIILTIILLPTILLISVGGGWLIAKRSLQPIDTIIDAVDSINDGNDLSARVNMSKGAIEITRLSQEFDSMFERLEKSFEAEKQFASDASHELRTPISVILGECDIAKRRNLSKEELMVALNSIEKQTLQMSELIEQLLNLTMLQQGTSRFPIDNLNLSEFVNAICEDFTLETNHNRTINLNITEEIYANFNPSLMSRVIYNLLDNAVKYTNDKGTISVTLSQDNGKSILLIEDDGVGISADNLPYIWNRFWQADPSRSLNTGVGLGLSLVKEIMEFLNGNVEVESTLGKGTRFIVTL